MFICIKLPFSYFTDHLPALRISSLLINCISCTDLLPALYLLYSIILISCTDLPPALWMSSWRLDSEGLASRIVHQTASRCLEIQASENQTETTAPARCSGWASQTR